jgi:hypothetical protein
MVSGSVVSSFQGAPRLTHAVDIVIDVPAHSVARLIEALAAPDLSGGSEKQVLDAIGVYEVQAGALDERYLDDWGERLGVQDSLARVRAEAKPIAP